MKYNLMLVFMFLFSGCYSTYNKAPSYENYVLNKVRDADYTKPYADVSNIYQNLNGAIVSIADQLLITNVSKTKNTSIILTSFADLNKLNETTTFGRLVSESMFNELHIRKFTVSDFRGQEAISVNADGEFHITRDVDKLKDHINEIEYIVVGTYVKFENDTILINARILDSISGAIISTARVIYKPIDCSLFDMCTSKPKKVKSTADCNLNNSCNKTTNYAIDIVTDNCSKVSCPKQNCKDGICDNSMLY
ncbi:MAG: FlgO family outer membrane protein [Campylobacterota bacterium]|nr:FlgO family outer membrane protein [Campylobacterota bacterium]